MASADHKRSPIKIPEDRFRGFMVVGSGYFRKILYAIAALLCWQIFARTAVNTA